MAGGAADRFHVRVRMRAATARRIRVHALTVTLALNVALAVPVIRAHLDARAAHLRTAALTDSLGAARAVAGAMETYDIEQGTLPPAAGATALAAALGPFLPWPVLAGGAEHPFAYTITPGGYLLKFTPAAGGVPVLLQVTLGVGGVAVVSSSRVDIGW